MRIKFPILSRIGLRTKLLAAVWGIVLSIIALQSGLMVRTLRLNNRVAAEKSLFFLYDSLGDEVHVMENAAAALAVSLADRSDLQALVYQRDRQALLDLLTPLFVTLRSDHNISHLYIHQADGTVLLRVHAPEFFGDPTLPYRPIGAVALTEQRVVAGVELDPDRLGVRGMAPILFQEHLLGLVEVGLNYDRTFLQDLKRRTAAEYRVWLSLDAAAPTGLWPRGDEPPAPSPKLFHYAATHAHPFPISAPLYEQVIQEAALTVQFVSADGESWAVLLAPLYGYGKRILGVVEIAISRTQALRTLQRSLVSNLLFTGGLALFTMILLTLAIEPIVLQPVRRLHQVTQRRLAGDLDARAEHLPRDELGALGEAFNQLGDRINALIDDLEQQIQISRQAEASLRVQSEQVDRFFTLALDLLCIANTEGYFLRVNPEWEKTLDYTVKDLNGCRFLDLVHPDDIPATLQAIQDLADSKEVLNFVNRYRRRDGSYRWLEWRSSSAGHLIYAAARDITGRIQSEAALRESEARFRQIVEASPMGMHMYRLEQNRLVFIGANPAAERILGLDHTQFIGKTIEEAFPPLAQTEVPMRYRLAAREGIAWKADQIDYQDEQIRGAFEVYAFQTGPEQMTAMFLDITERKQTEQKILQRTAELATLNALAREISASLALQHTLSVALKGLIEVIHPSLTFLFMREGDRLKLQQILPPEAEKRLIEIPEHRVGECICGLAVIQKKALYSRNIMHDARCTWEECKKAGIISFAALPLYDGEEVTGVIGVAADQERDFETRAEFLETLASHVSVALVNARLFETVQRYAAELEQRVQERTAQLELANRELEAFAYSVSHDLRAPLRAIDGFSQALEEDCGDQIDATGQGYIRRIRNAAQRMGELIDGLLQLSRITRGELNYERVNLSALTTEIATELEHAHPQRRFEWQITPGVYAWGDRRMLRAALENLLDNAVKFTIHREYARIEFGCVQSAGEQAIYIRDNGAGFDMAYADKLFGAFQRLHTAGEFPGSGIGLATVQRIIHRHGGRIWAEGQVDRGATFWFTLPQMEQEI